jgi:hypothetical protein
MVTLCCTKVLLKRLGPQSHVLPQPPTCALGNWFANVIHVRAQPIVMAMSERAFIPVLFPARALRENLVPAFLRAVASLLERIGAAQGTVERELALMSPTLIAPTNSRQVLSVMNQRALEVRFIVQHRPSLSLPEAELHFASGLTGPLGLVNPQEAALGLLSALHSVM